MAISDGTYPQAPLRMLGLGASASIIIGAVIGSGVFINIPIVARYAGSPGIALLIWLAGGLVWLPQIVLLAEMGTAYPNQGGPYYFLYKAGSPFLAFLYTWTAFLTSDTPTITIIALLAASAVSYLLPVFINPFAAKLFAASLICLFAYIQSRNLKTGAMVQIVLTLSKVLPLALIVVLGLWFLDSGNFFWSQPRSANSAGPLFYTISTGISTTVWAYAGFVNILYMAGEVKNPSVNLPRALIGSVAFVIVAYTALCICTSLIVPFSELLAVKEGTFVNPFLYMSFFSGSAGAMFAVFFLISMLGVLNSVIMTQPRLEYAMARDNLFFQAFGKLHPRHATPHYSIWIQSLLAIALFLLGDIETMLGYFSLSYVLQNALVYGAVVKLRAQDGYRPSYRVRHWKAAVVFSVGAQLFLAYGIFTAFPLGGTLACAALILTAIPVYFYYHRNRPDAPPLE
jgi:fructoselysine transporter